MTAVDRRQVLRGLAVSTVAAALQHVDPARGPNVIEPPRHRLIWAADFSADDSNGAGFGAVQRQFGGGPIHTSHRPVPIVDAPYGMGRAGLLHLRRNAERLECAPRHSAHLVDGMRRYFRFDFALEHDYPLDQPNSFCLLNQIHHGGSTGSPPLEFDVYRRQLAIRGGWGSPSGRTYERHVCRIVKGQRYSVVYGVTFGSQRKDSVVDVWVDGVHRIVGFHPPCSTTYGQGPAYWKGMTMYCDPSIPPLTVYQNAHATGTTHHSVARHAPR